MWLHNVHICVGKSDVAFRPLTEVAAILATKLCFNLVEIFLSNLNSDTDSTSVKYREIWTDTANRSCSSSSYRNGSLILPIAFSGFNILPDIEESSLVGCDAVSICK